jgi:hypothetical protein
VCLNGSVLKLDNGKIFVKNWTPNLTSPWFYQSIRDLLWHSTGTKCKFAIETCCWKQWFQNVSDKLSVLGAIYIWDALCIDCGKSNWCWQIMEKNVAVMNLINAYGMRWMASQYWYCCALAKHNVHVKVDSENIVWWFDVELIQIRKCWVILKLFYADDRKVSAELTLEMCIISETAVKWVWEVTGLFGVPSWHT